MQLSAPVSLTFPTVDGTVTEEINTLDTIFIDHAARKIVLARVLPTCRPLPLWVGEAYDAIGDWTQEQAEARLLELLGENPQEMLQSLVVS